MAIYTCLPGRVRLKGGSWGKGKEYQGVPLLLLWQWPSNLNRTGSTPRLVVERGIERVIHHGLWCTLWETLFWTWAALPCITWFAATLCKALPYRGIGRESLHSANLSREIWEQNYYVKTAILAFLLLGLSFSLKRFIFLSRLLPRGHRFLAVL